MGKFFHADQKEVRDLNLVSAGTRAGKGTDRNETELDWENVNSLLSMQNSKYPYFF